jgi:hypothetical protein
MMKTINDTNEQKCGNIKELLFDYLRNYFEFILLRYETPYSPAGGIAPVVDKERNNYHGGLIIAPYFKNIKKTKNGELLSTGIIFNAGEYAEYKIEVIITHDSFPYTKGKPIPVIFLAVTNGNFFTPIKTPYYEGEPDISKEICAIKLKTDSLIFGIAVKAFFEYLIEMDVSLGRKFCNAADWQTAPALFMIKSMVNKKSVTLHNTYDAWLGSEAKTINTYKSTPFSGEETALQIGLRFADAVATVNRGFEWGIFNEIVQKHSLAGHLLPYLRNKFIGIDNGRFRDLNLKEMEILVTSRNNTKEAIAKLFDYRESAQESIGKSLKERGIHIDFKNKAVFGFFGRLSAQKLHDVSATSVRRFLQTGSNKERAIFFFSVLPATEDTRRQKQLEKLMGEFPDNVVYTYDIDDCPYYEKLSTAAVDWNCLFSLYEPHGAVFQGANSILVRAVDGLNEQVNDPLTVKEAGKRNRQFHQTHEPISGIKVFEELPDSISEEQLIGQYTALNSCGLSLSDNNQVFNAMVDALTCGIERAVKLRLDNTNEYTSMVFTSLEKQTQGDWSVNLRELKRMHIIKN